jgi:protein-disulfide isomerase
MNNSPELTPPVSERDHIEGQSGAPLTLVEFGDYQCPYCGEAHAVIKRLQKALGRRLRFIFRNFPLTEIHPYALLAAETAEASALQDKFWQMHNLIFENQQLLEPEVLPAWAHKLGLDMKLFATDLQQGDIIKRIEEDRASGMQSGVSGTPAFFINGTQFDGEADYDSLHKALLQQEAIARARI